MRRRRDLPAVAPQPWAALVPADSFYARLAGLRDVLVDDEPYAPLYKDSRRGRPSVPPSLVVLAMLLQYHDDCSDAEAEQRLRFDLRWGSVWRTGASTRRCCAGSGASCWTRGWSGRCSTGW